MLIVQTIHLLSTFDHIDLENSDNMCIIIFLQY